MRGKRVTLDEAKSEMGFPIYRPQDELASDESISAVWTEVAEPLLKHAAIEYESGVTITLDPQQQPGDPKLAWESEAAEIGPKASVDTVHGVDALVIPAGIQPGTPASVTLILDGVQIALYHPSLSTDDLIRIADSIEP